MTYDSYGNLAGYSAVYQPSSGNPRTLYSYSLTRDSMSRISAKTETVLGVTDTYAYSYDVLGRLTAVTKNSSPYSEYVYDSNGNRTSGTHAGVPFVATYDDQDRILTLNSRAYVYSRSGDLAKIYWNSLQQSLLRFDALGQLTDVTRRDGKRVQYLYDGGMRVTSSLIDEEVGGYSTYEGDLKVIGEFSKNGVRKTRYVHATRPNTPDYMIKEGVTYRLIMDHLGSPRLIVNVSTGKAVQRIDYTEFGKVLVDTQAGFQPYGFAGGLNDAHTGFVKFGARYYDPEVGRWTSKDPILFKGGDTNLYGYVMNDPVNFTDSTGLLTDQERSTAAKYAGYGALAGTAVGVCTSAGLATAGYAAAGAGAGWLYGAGPGLVRDFKELVDSVITPGQPMSEGNVFNSIRSSP